jgi:hypothetical protein
MGSLLITGLTSVSADFDPKWFACGQSPSARSDGRKSGVVVAAGTRATVL